MSFRKLARWRWLAASESRGPAAVVADTFDRAALEATIHLPLQLCFRDFIQVTRVAHAALLAFRLRRFSRRASCIQSSRRLNTLCRISQRRAQKRRACSSEPLPAIRIPALVNRRAVMSSLARSSSSMCHLRIMLHRLRLHTGIVTRCSTTIRFSVFMLRYFLSGFRGSQCAPAVSGWWDSSLPICAGASASGRLMP